MMKNKYFGCDCYCLNHIALFGYYLPEKGEKIDEEYNDIYLTVKTEYLYRNILPPINPMNLDYYFRYHILRRVPVALKSIFKKNYDPKHGILDCFDFMNENLSEIKEFLSNLTDSKSISLKDSTVVIDNGEWPIVFYINQHEDELPCWLGWKIRFRPRNLLGRIGYALKYLFGQINNEQNFEINKKNAEAIKGLIAVVEEANNERT